MTTWQSMSYFDKPISIIIPMKVEKPKEIEKGTGCHSFLMSENDNKSQIICIFKCQNGQSFFKLGVTLGNYLDAYPTRTNIKESV